MRSAVTNYLLNLTSGDLANIAADFLGQEHDDVNLDTAIQWVDGLSDDEVKEIWAEMVGE